MKWTCLTRQDLVLDQCYIDGQWVKGDGKTIRVDSPATGDIIAQVPNLGGAETNKAIAAAAKAFQSWRALPAKDRSAYLFRWADLIIQHADDLAKIMTLEQGKPLAEAKGEVIYGASFVTWFAEEAKRVYGDIIPAPQADKRILVLKQPIGVVAAITPWNFPSAMITRKCAPALAAGCTVVLKPAEQTPLSALALAKLAEEAGIPAGVINVMTGDAEVIGPILTTHPLVKKISFTGSTEVGRLLMQQGSATIKKISLELGGNAPFIVFSDADLDKAVEGAIASKFRNSGQTCVCANRILVQDGVYDQFVAALSRAVATLKVGFGMEDGVQQGPLIDHHALKKVQDLLQDAVDKGAEIKVGGKKLPQGPLFFEPTVVCDVTSQMRMAQEEIFGPVAAVYRFKNDEEAIHLANDTIYGLAAYFYSADLKRVWHVMEQLDYGIVGVNTGIISSEVAPFGGVKQSGIGREGSRYGMDDYLEMKYVSLAGLG